MISKRSGYKATFDLYFANGVAKASMTNRRNGLLFKIGYNILRIALHIMYEDIEQKVI